MRWAPPRLPPCPHLQGHAALGHHLWHWPAGSFQLAHLLRSGALAAELHAVATAAAADVRAAVGANDTAAEERVAALLRSAMLPPFDAAVRAGAYGELSDGDAYVAVRTDALLMRTLAFLLCPRLRLSGAAAEQAQATTRLAVPLLRLADLPAAVRGALEAYDRALLTATQTYLRVGILRGTAAEAPGSGRGTQGWGAPGVVAADPGGRCLPPAARLPLSGITWGAAAAGAAAGAAAPLAARIVLRSPFSALRGRDDRFRSLRELASELRGGVTLHQVRRGVGATSCQTRVLTCCCCCYCCTDPRRTRRHRSSPTCAAMQCCPLRQSSCGAARSRPPPPPRA